MFNLAIDSKLRSCDLVHLRERDVYHGYGVVPRAMVLQQKTHQPVQFELTEQTREALTNWMGHHYCHPDDYLFPSRLNRAHHLSTRQYARIVHKWVEMIGPRSLSLWHAFIAKNKSYAHLPEDKKSTSRSASVRPHQTRKHGTISRDRSGRCARDGGTDRSLNERTTSALSNRVAIRPETVIRCERGE